MSLITPPEDVRGMTKFVKEKFSRSVKVPYVAVDVHKFKDIKNILKPYSLNPKLLNMQSLDNSLDSQKLIHLNPDIIHNFDDFKDEDKEKLKNSFGIDELKTREITLTTRNYKTDVILKSVLPKGMEVAAWSIIGHIIHLNLKDHLLPYKYVVGEILLEKHRPRIKMVVNKLDSIDTTFRTFQMEVLAKDSDDSVSTIVEVKESNCTFKFDFASVYWNPRLCTEHERIINLLSKSDILCDVFAGVGPFAVPAAKKQCNVFANDLNPECFRWLIENAKRNKCEKFLTAYNMDGRQFVKNVVKQEVLKYWNEDKGNNFHIVMNLPALAVQFLDAFVGLFDDAEDNDISRRMPTIHCYGFLKGIFEDPKSEIREMVENSLKTKIGMQSEIFTVRTVAPNKIMFRITFELPKLVLFQDSCNKRQKLD